MFNYEANGKCYKLETKQKFGDAKSLFLGLFETSQNRQFCIENLSIKIATAEKKYTLT